MSLNTKTKKLLWFSFLVLVIGVVLLAVFAQSYRQMNDAYAQFTSPAPVLDFPFNSGNIQQDQSLNGNDGTVFGAQYVTTGCINGGCMKFNGSSDYIEVPHSSTLDMDSEYTASAWVYWSDKGYGDQWILSKGDASNSAENYSFYVNATNVRGITHVVNVGGTRDIYNTPLRSVSPNKWTYVAVTYDGVSAITYIDGSYSASAKYGLAPIANRNPLRIGNQKYSPFYFNGYLDELKIYDHALTSKEIRSEFLSGFVNQSRSPQISPVCQIEYAATLKSFSNTDSFVGVDISTDGGKTFTAVNISSATFTSSKSNTPIPLTVDNLNSSFYQIRNVPTSSGSDIYMKYVIDGTTSGLTGVDVSNAVIRLRVQDTYGNFTKSDSSPFALDCKPPAAFSSPVVVSNITDTTARVDWGLSSGASSYEIAVGVVQADVNNHNGSAVLGTVPNPQSTSVIVTGLTPSTQYYVSLRALDQNANYVSSGTPVSFTTLVSSTGTGGTGGGGTGTGGGGTGGTGSGGTGTGGTGGTGSGGTGGTGTGTGGSGGSGGTGGTGTGGSGGTGGTGGTGTGGSGGTGGTGGTGTGGSGGTGGTGGTGTGTGTGGTGSGGTGGSGSGGTGTGGSGSGGTGGTGGGGTGTGGTGTGGSGSGGTGGTGGGGTGTGGTGGTGTGGSGGTGGTGTGTGGSGSGGTGGTGTGTGGSGGGGTGSGGTGGTGTGTGGSGGSGGTGGTGTGGSGGTGGTGGTGTGTGTGGTGSGGTGGSGSGGTGTGGSGSGGTGTGTGGSGSGGTGGTGTGTGGSGGGRGRRFGGGSGGSSGATGSSIVAPRATTLTVPVRSNLNKDNTSLVIEKNDSQETIEIVNCFVVFCTNAEEKDFYENIYSQHPDLSKLEKEVVVFFGILKREGLTVDDLTEGFNREIASAIAAIIVKEHGLVTDEDILSRSIDPFPDVSIDSRFGRIIALVKDLGIVNGFDNGDFGPGEPLRAAQAYKVITRLFVLFNSKLASDLVNTINKLPIGFDWFSPFVVTLSGYMPVFTDAKDLHSEVSSSFYLLMINTILTKLGIDDPLTVASTASVSFIQ